MLGVSLFAATTLRLLGLLFGYLFGEVKVKSTIMGGM